MKKLVIWLRDWCNLWLINHHKVEPPSMIACNGEDYFRVASLMPNCFGELRKDAQYLVCWKRPMSPALMTVVREALERAGVKVTVLCGVDEMLVYQLAPWSHPTDKRTWDYPYPSPDLKSEVQ